MKLRIVAISLVTFALTLSFVCDASLAGQPDSGQAFYWGTNYYGQFGDGNGNKNPFWLPVPGYSLAPNKPIMIVGDKYCVLEVMPNGLVYQLGRPNNNAIGNGLLEQGSTGLSNIVGVSEDDGYACAWDTASHAWIGLAPDFSLVTDSTTNSLNSVINGWAGESGFFYNIQTNFQPWLYVFTRSDGSVFYQNLVMSYATSLDWLSRSVSATSLTDSPSVISARMANFQSGQECWVFQMSDSSILTGAITSTNSVPAILKQITYTNSSGIQIPLTGIVGLAADEMAPQFALTNSGQAYQLDLVNGTASSFTFSDWGTDRVVAIYGNDGAYMAVTSDSLSHTMAWFFYYEYQSNGTYLLPLSQIPETTSGGSLWGVNLLVGLAGVGDYGLAFLTCSDGSVWGWDPYIYDPSSVFPVQIRNNVTGSADNVISIALGQKHGLRLLSGGNVSAGGFNQNGQLGNNDNYKSPYSPVPYFTVSGVSNAIDVATGQIHSLALSSSNTVWAWGDDSYGQLGDGNGGAGVTNSLATIIPNLNNIAAIAAGGDQSLAILSTSAVMQWGRVTSEYGSWQYLTPSPVFDCSNNQVFGIEIAAGLNHALALTVSGTVWAWGDNSVGQLGDYQNESFSASAVQVMTASFDTSGNPIPLTGVIGIAAGDNFSLALTNSGEVYAWGDNSRCQCGNADFPYFTLAKLVSSLSCSGLDSNRDTIITVLSAGSSHALALTVSGTVWAWGDDTYGQLGDGGFVQNMLGCTASAVPVLNMSGSSLLENVFNIAAGGCTSAAISSSTETPSQGNLSVTVGYSPSGSVSVSPKYTGFSINDVATVKAIPNPGWQFDSWNVTNGIVTPGTSQALLVVSGNVTISANWASPRTVGAPCVSSGSPRTLRG